MYTQIASALVFKGPVQSGLSTPRAVDRDRDRSTSVQGPQKTAQNRRKPVLIGLLQSLTGLDRKFNMQLIHYVFYISSLVGIIDLHITFNLSSGTLKMVKN